MNTLRNTWAEVELDCITHNLWEARRIVSENTRISAVLKANAYGHGAVRVADTLIENGVDQLSVACLSEALELRQNYKEIPIMVMGYTPDRHLSIAIKNRIIITVASLEQGKTISEIAGILNKKAVIHIKLDTGLNRLGIRAGTEAVSLISDICRLSNVYVEGIFTHLALTSPELDQLQFDLFMDTVDKIEALGIKIPIRHVSDSNGMVLYPEFDLDMVRPGGFLFGVTTAGLFKDVISLRPALTFKTQITRIQEIEAGEGVGYDSAFVAGDKCIVGTIGVGYSDGYMRCLSGKGEVSIRGKRAPVIGIICMDQCMVDLTNIPEAEVEDEVLLFGSGSQATIHINELAEKAETNRNEILSAISRRVPRVYIKDSNVIGVVDYLLDRYKD